MIVNITLIGVGAIGSLFAHSFAMAEHQVHVWSRDLSPYRTLDTLSLYSKESKHWQFPNRNPSLLAESQLVIYCVKAFQLEQAILDTKAHISPDATIMICHNGMGTQPLVQQHFPDNAILYASTTQAALLTEKYKVTHTGIGTTTFGWITTPPMYAEAITQILNQALHPTLWLTDIQEALWKKLAINCVINPLTALYHCSNGALLQAQYAEIVHQLCDEIALVMSASGYSTQTTELEAQVKNIMEATAHNYSSLHQDIAHHRPTEIQFITGYLCQQAKQLGLAIPQNDALLTQIHQLEANS